MSKRIEECVGCGGPCHQDAARCWSCYNAHRDPIAPELFWTWVDQSAGTHGCWPWMRSTNRGGYGFVVRQRHVYQAHRLAFQIATDSVLDSRTYVLHRCDNPPCCNPSHLFAGTQTDNVRDAMSKGRHKAPPHPRGERHHRAVLTEANVREIRVLEGTQSHRALADRFGVSEAAIEDVCARRSWRHVA